MVRGIRGGARLAAALLLATSTATADSVKNTSYTVPGGMRVLEHQIVVRSPVDAVWQAFTTSEGWISWAAPVAFVDFRRGGIIETSYDPGAKPGDPANIKSEILSYLPRRMLSLRAIQTPPGFPYRELADNLWSVFQFEAVDEGSTRIVSTGAGYGEGEGYDTIYGFFEQANALMLQQLDRRLREGPIDWAKPLEAVPPHVTAGAPAERQRLPGVARSDRLIELVVVVDGPVDRTFDLWSTSDGADRFFGSGSTIEAREGGLYEIEFGLRPDGEVAGPRGTRILRYSPPDTLAFEWEMPFFARELNRRPLPTWVELRFESFGEDPDRTQVHLVHHGFGRGDAWDRSYVYFQRNWFEVLFRLKRYCATEADEGRTGSPG